MSTLTIYLARLIGLSAVLLVGALLVRGNALIMATVANGPVMLVYAIFSLAAGLAIILGHNVWSGGTLPVIVTLVGWLIFAKGLVLLLVTPETLTPLLERMQQQLPLPCVYRTGSNYRPLLDLRRFRCPVEAILINDFACLFTAEWRGPCRC